MSAEHSCSPLTFRPSPETAGPVRVDQLRRAREPISRSKSGVQGKVADGFHDRSRHAESQNEFDAFRILLATARADAWQEPPFAMHYHHEGTKHRDTPDILVVWGTHQEVVEVKEDAEAELAENRTRFARIGGLLAEHGYRFRIWKRSEISAQPRLRNANLVWRYRSVTVSAAEQERLRRVLSSTPEMRLGTLAETSPTPVQTVLRLVIEGARHLDWWKPLGLDSSVSIAPIGPQVWPVPPWPVSPTSFQEIGCR
jgi:hypothetical protein